MNINELDKELQSFPDDLQYSEAHWEKALAGIEAYEKKQRRKGIILYSTIGVIVLSLVTVLFIYESPQSHITEGTAQPGSTIDSLNTSDESVNQPLAKKIKSEKIQTSESTDESNSVVEEENPDVEVLVNTKESSSSNYPIEIELVENNENTTNTKIPAKSATSVSQSETMTPESDASENLASQLDSEEGVGVAASRDMASNESKKARVDYRRMKTQQIDNDLILPALATRDFEPIINDNRLWQMHVRIGTSIWSDFGKKDIALRDFTLGLMYQRTLNNSWSLGAGLDYFMVNDLPQTITRTQVNYTYGYDSTSTRLITDRLHYFAIPIEATYKVNSRLNATMTIGLSYMFWTENRLSVSTSNYEGIRTDQFSETSGYVDTYKRFNTYISPGITYQFSERFWLGGEFQIGLTDITPDEVFKSNLYDRNSKVFIYLRHRIW